MLYSAEYTNRESKLSSSTLVTRSGTSTTLAGVYHKTAKGYILPEAAAIMAMLATPTPCLLFPSGLNHRCPSLLPALHRPSFHPSSSSRLSSPSSATFSHRPHTQFFVRAAQSSAQNESATAEELDVRKERLRDLSKVLVLPAGYLEKLPNDLRVDLKDAAFALASGALNKECGEQAGDLLMQLSRSWERGDTQANAASAKQLPSLLGKLPSESSFQFVGKRFLRAGRHFTATGQYEGGELQKIGKALSAAGDAFSSGNRPVVEEPITSTKSFKFGDLQVDITAQRAYIGAGIAFAFGLLSWKLVAGLQNVSESSIQYANDNADLLASSLKGTLLTAGYSCTLLSAFTTVGLLVLASGLGAEKK